MSLLEISILVYHYLFRRKLWWGAKGPGCLKRGVISYRREEYLGESSSKLLETQLIGLSTLRTLVPNDVAIFTSVSVAGLNFTVRFDNRSSGET